MTTIKETPPADRAAGEIIAKIYDDLRSVGLEPGDCSTWISRFVFCLAWEDLSILPRNFVRALLRHARADGADAGPLIAEMFATLGTPEGKRPRSLRPHLGQLPHWPSWFGDPLPEPIFDAGMFRRLLEAARFDWRDIDPAALGTIIQTVGDPGTRRRLGSNYTTESNVLKIVGPVILNELRGELDDADRDEGSLVELLDRLTGIDVLDAAAGSGNFLAIAYREMCDIELSVYRILVADHPERWGRIVADPGTVRIRPGKFHGIEIARLPFDISRMVLALMVHKMEGRFAETFRLKYDPYDHQPQVADLRLGNALDIEWRDVVPPGDNLRIIGNPPFSGLDLTPDQREDMRRVWKDIIGAGDLDYVACWFLLAFEMIKGTRAKAGFIATSSLFQGSQVPVFWRVLGSRGARVDDAWRPFKWGNPAPGATSVHVVAVCISHKGSGDIGVPALHFPGDPDRVERPKIINGYLVGVERDVIVERSKAPISRLPRLQRGVDFRDGSGAKNGGSKNAGLIMDEKGRDELRADPDTHRFIREAVGGGELVKDPPRWCLDLAGSTRSDREIPGIKNRIESTARARKGMKGDVADAPPHLPYRGAHTGKMNEAILVFGNAGTGKRRSYIPAAFVPSTWVPLSTVNVLYQGTLFDFGVVVSRYFRLWTDTVAGRQRDDPRVNIEGVWNTFPLPNLSPVQIDRISAAARRVLDARPPGVWPLRNMYDPGRMPPALLAAHEELDREFDAAYGPVAPSDEKRLSYLFDRYARLRVHPTLPF